MKKKTSLLLALILLFCVHISAQNTEKYKTYHNERFDFCLLYPNYYTEGVAPANGDGLSFHNKKQESNITTYGALQMPEETLKSLYQEAKNEAGVSYHVINPKENFFVVSGISNDEIFYQKTVISGDKVLTFIIRYPKSEKKQFDSIVQKMSASFPNCQ